MTSTSSVYIGPPARLVHYMEWKWVYTASKISHILDMENKSLRAIPNLYPVETEAGPGVFWKGFGLHLNKGGEIGSYAVKYPLSLSCPLYKLWEGTEDLPQNKECLFIHSRIFCGKSNTLFCAEQVALSRERILGRLVGDPITILSGEFLLDSIRNDAQYLRSMAPRDEAFLRHITPRSQHER